MCGIKFYPFHTWENVKSLHFFMVTNWDSGFAEVSLRRSPRIKQLSLSRTNSGSFYSGSQPKSRSVQRVHSFQQDKSGNVLAHLPSGVWAYLVGCVFGKSTKFDISFLDTGAEQVCPLEVQGNEQSMTISNSVLPLDSYNRSSTLS